MKETLLFKIVEEDTDSCRSSVVWLVTRSLKSDKISWELETHVSAMLKGKEWKRLCHLMFQKLKKSPCLDFFDLLLISMMWYPSPLYDKQWILHLSNCHWLVTIFSLVTKLYPSYLIIIMSYVSSNEYMDIVVEQSWIRVGQEVKKATRLEWRTAQAQGNKHYHAVTLIIKYFKTWTSLVCK